MEDPTRGYLCHVAGGMHTAPCATRHDRRSLGMPIPRRLAAALLALDAVAVIEGPEGAAGALDESSAADGASLGAAEF